jgi:energy-converting hydrogenase Eha subunit A
MLIAIVLGSPIADRDDPARFSHERTLVASDRMARIDVDRT